LELNDVRRALFILYENDLATYRRVRDEDSGWLTYLWTFHYDNIPENLEEEMYRLLDALEEREEYERTHEFYLCEVCSIRFEFGEAMDFGFECPSAALRSRRWTTTGSARRWGSASRSSVTSSTWT